ncbi:MAG TPA: HlyC/CorC family transporter [Anaerolineae bacterium]|nr:HlyC/CorC family transporter [Anaerolineae bacterium]
MINLITGTIIFLGVMLLDMLLTLARCAFVNSHPTRLKGIEEEGVAWASRTVRVASEARPLILSLRAAQSLSRLIVVGLAIITYASPVPVNDGGYMLVVAGVLLGTGLSMGLFEFLAEQIALRKPEHWAVRLTPLVLVLVSLLSPIVWFMLRIASWITGVAGERSHPMVTEEEIMTLVDAGEEEGVIEEEEKAMIYSIFQLADTLAREVMVPRIDILAFEDTTSLVEATETLLRTGFSRAPVYSGSIDNIIGLLYVKDLLKAWCEGKQDQSVASIMREAYFVPEAKKVDDLLAELQAMRVHMAIVVDEYGGTAGLVTFEDMVEEIVGEIRDEYDYAEELSFQVLREGEFLFSGLIDLDDVNQITDAALPKETSETLGGFIYSQLGKVPSPGEVVEAGGLYLVVEEVSGRRIRKVRAHRVEGQPMETGKEGDND